MLVNRQSVEMASEPTESASRRNCKCKYKVRWFYSKGAFLVLVWCILVSITASSMIRAFTRLIQNWYPFSYWIGLIPCSVAVPSLICSGWLADNKFGKYRVARFGLYTLFTGTLSISVLSLFPDFVLGNPYIAAVSFCIVSSLTTIGLAGFSLMLVQLGLDQMPDASSSNITSFVAWFVFCVFAGFWISLLLYQIQWNCMSQDFNSSNNMQIWSLHLLLCISIILVSDYLFSKKWLIIEPTSPQSLKIIYQVLNFAAKHKAPINRSALTYWEEDIPSRMDLGKSKYGGPFTTEQVENVKTILQLMGVSFSIWVIAISLYLHPVITRVPQNMKLPNLTQCSLSLLSLFTYSPHWCSIVATVIYEIAIYPIIGDRIPSILRRIGFVSLLTIFLSLVLLTLELIQHFYSDEQATIWLTIILHSVSKGLLSWQLSCATLELVLAQAPYNMRGLFAGFAAILIGVSIFAGDMLSYYSGFLCKNCNIRVVFFGAKLALSLFAFILYCILARRYKRRVRDDVFSPHRVVEEVYDRYLTAESQRRQYTAAQS